MTNDGHRRARAAANDPTSREAQTGLPRWAAIAVFFGGLFLILIWAAFTAVHGPTSTNRGGGASIGLTRLLALPNLLIWAGALCLRPRKPFGSAVARLGYAVMSAGLLLWAVIDLLAFVPVGPFLAGVGSIMFASGLSEGTAWSRQSRLLLLAWGLSAAIGTLLFFALPLEVSDQYGGFRILGIMTYLVPGIAWMAIAASHFRSRS